MVNNEFLLDPVIFGVLGELKREKELRYSQIKRNLERRRKILVSHSTLTKKLVLLKRHYLIAADIRTKENGGNFIVYTLTEAGEKTVSTIEPSALLEKLEGLRLPTVPNTA